MGHMLYSADVWTVTYVTYVCAGQSVEQYQNSRAWAKFSLKGNRDY